MVHIIQQSVLEKILPNNHSFKEPFNKASALIGEEFAYQIVLYNDEQKTERFTIKQCHGLPCHLYLVRQVPVTWPHHLAKSSGRYLLDRAGVLPDCLIPIDEDEEIMVGPIPTVVLVCIESIVAGTFRCEFEFISQTETLSSHFQLEIINREMAKPAFRYYEQIYAKAIAEDYHCPLFSELFWIALEKYFDVAAVHGVTDVFVPLFPSPSEGEALQLMRIEKDKSDYKFNFDLFDSWVCLARQKGIKHFWLPPLFPNIGKRSIIPFKYTAGDFTHPLFGDEITTDDSDYLVFLDRLLRAFYKHLNELYLTRCVSFQLTDWIDPKHYILYEEHKKWFLKILRNVRLIDSLGDVSLYNEIDFGAPCVPMHLIQDFIKNFAVQGMVSFDPSCYTPTSDLLIASRAADLRVLGVISYRYRIGGLMNRGFNFNSSASGESGFPLNLNLDAGNSFPSGALSLVYSGPDGPLPSMRLKLLQYAMQDIRAIEALEAYVPYEKICSLINKKYPLPLERSKSTAEKILALREELNQLIKEHCQK